VRALVDPVVFSADLTGLCERSPSSVDDHDSAQLPAALFLAHGHEQLLDLRHALGQLLLAVRADVHVQRLVFVRHRRLPRTLQPRALATHADVTPCLLLQPLLVLPAGTDNHALKVVAAARHGAQRSARSRRRGAYSGYLSTGM